MKSLSAPSRRKGLSFRVNALLRTMAPYLLLFALPFVFFWRVILPIPSLAATFAHGDFINVFYPFYNFVVRSYWAGRFPLWNPHIYGGYPSVGDLQFASFYPPLLVAGLLAGPTGFSTFFLEVFALLHLSLAGLGTYLFASLHLPDRRAAVLSATVFVLGGYLTSFPLSQLGILGASAWLPFILLFIERGFRGRSWNFLLAGPCFAISFLAGHPQTALYIAYLMVAYFISRAARGAADRGFLWTGFAGIFILWPAIGLSAVQWIPSLELVQNSSRGLLPYVESAVGLQLREIAAMVVPVFGGNAGVYVGMLPLALALVALIFGHGGWRLFWGLVALLALLLAFGGNGPLFAWIYPWAPGFGLFRQQERSLFLYNFAIALLAGYGVQSLLTQQFRLESTRARLLGIGLLGMGAGFLLLGQALPPGDSLAWSRYFLSLVFYLPAVVVLWRWVRSSSRHGLFFLGAWGLTFVNLFLFNSSQALVPRHEPFPVLQAIRFIQADPSMPFRISTEGLLPGDGNGSMIYGLQDIVGSTPLQLKTTEAFWQEVGDEWIKWNLYGVKYALTKRYFQRQGAVLAHQEDGLYLYRLSDPLPRAYLVHEALTASDFEEGAKLINSPEFDFRAMAVLPGTVDLPLSPGGLPGEGVEVLAQGPGHLLLEARTPLKALLVVSERNYPGWRAWIDGQEVELHQANLIFMALFLEPGSHQVELRFDPLSFKLGLGISLLTLLGVAAMLGLEVRRLKKPPDPKAPVPVL